MGLSGGASGKEPIANAADVRVMGLILGLGKIPWGRAWQSTLVLLPGEFHEQRSLVSFSPWRHKELATTEAA